LLAFERQSGALSRAQLLQNLFPSISTFLDDYRVSKGLLALPLPQKRQEATAVNRRLPVSFKALIRRGSRLAVMHANNDSLGVRSASVSGSDAEGRPLEVRQTDFLHLDALQLWHSLRPCPAAVTASVDKIDSRYSPQSPGSSLLTNLPPICAPTLPRSRHTRAPARCGRARSSSGVRA
jgi:hypothetical protein